jgi:glycyl-tRNA synthetase (class II)
MTLNGRLLKVFQNASAKGLYIVRGDGREGLKDVIGYGPLGAAMRKNFIAEWEYWCASADASCNVHGLHHLGINDGIIIDWISNGTLKLSQPFGVMYSSSDHDVRSSMGSEVMTLWYCSSSSDGDDWTTYWKRRRLKWWKRLSRYPENFITKQDGPSSMTIKYMTEDEQIPLEDIRISQDIISNSCIIDCSIKLQAGIWCMMMDGYMSDKRQWDDETSNALLGIDRRLAPIKVAILPQEYSDDQRIFCDRIVDELNVVGISAQCSYHGNLGKRLAYHDEIGTPSRLLSDNNTLMNGVMYLQDRDSGLSEPVESESILSLIQKMYMRYKDVI